MTVKKAATKKAATKIMDHNDPKFLVTQYNMTDANLRKLAKLYDPELIPEAKEKGDEAYQVIHNNVMEITKVRTSIDKKRKELKEDALAWGKKVDGEARRLTEIVKNLEEPWRKIKEELDNQEKIKLQKQQEAEEKLMAMIEANIQEIKSMTEGLIVSTSEDIKGRIEKCSAIEITEDRFGEHAEAAEFHKNAALETLNSALADRVRMEEQEKIMEEQRKQMEEQQRLIDEQQAEIYRQNEERTKADRQAKEEAERREREIRESEEAKRKETELSERLPEDVKVRDYADKINEMVHSTIPDIKSDALNELILSYSLLMDQAYSLIKDNTQNAGE